MAGKIARRVSLLVTTLAALSLLTVACQGTSPAASSNSKELTKVKFVTGSTVPQLSVAAQLMAQMVGYMAEEGLDVEIIGSREGTAQVIQLLANGQIDYASPAPEVVLVPAGQGRDPELIFFYEVNRKPQVEIAVSPDSPLKDWKEMRGKKFGVSNIGNAAQKVVEAALKEVGIDPVKEAEFLEIGRAGTAAKAMADKAVDVLIQTDTEMATIRETYKTPLRSIAPPARTQLTFGSSLLTSISTLKAKREQVIGFGRATAKGTIFALENPEATVRLYWQYIPEQKPKNVSEAEAMKLSLIELRSRLDKSVLDGPNDRWGFFKAEQLDAELDFLDLKGKLQPEKYFTNELIDEINKFDANKVREFARSYKVPS